MPYGRRYSGRGRRTFRKRYTSRRSAGRSFGYGDIAKKVVRDIAYLKSIVNVERKHLEYTASTTSSTTLQLVLVNGSIPGDSGETRDGQSIKLASLLLRYSVTIHASATATIHRVLVVLDTQPNAANFAAGDLLDTAGNVLSPLNVTYGSRFRVLRDIIIHVDSTNKIKTVQKFIKLSDHTKFNAGTAGTIADISSNALYVCHISSEATNVPTFDYFARTRFIDN